MEVADGDESCWPARGRPALRKARAIAVKKKLAQYTASVPYGNGDATREVTYYINYSKCPNIIERVVEEYIGPKQGQRPHKQARDAGKKRVRDAHVADHHTGFEGDFTSTVQMPDESRPEDTGWLPGPCPGGPQGRPLPKFTGPKQGPSDSSLSSTSSAIEIMDNLLTEDICQELLNCLKENGIRYRDEHHQDDNNEDAWFIPPKAAVERTFLNLDEMNTDHVRLWVCAKLRIAQLSPAMPQEELWDR